ncbi:hypothetical protein Q91_2048 [Cycloclasticus sp. P1]|nr:hypothetical protein Q91_2048 [Cycloclasticus sp. P1]
MLPIYMVMSQVRQILLKLLLLTVDQLGTHLAINTLVMA